MSKYQELDKLPSNGVQGVLYIVPNEEGKKIAYEWMETSTGEFTFVEYSSWYDDVSSFPINDIGATFYLSGTALSTIGAMYFEKDHKNENTYYSKDRGITSTIANSLFGWGYQATTTWTEYVTKANLKLNIENDDIVSADLGLSVLANVPNIGYGEQKIYYTISDFGSASVKKVENFVNGGNKNA